MIRVPVFRIFYSTTFSILLLLTLALLAVTPADGIYQSFRNGQNWSIIIIAAVYLLAAIVTLFIYATRLYTTRTILAAIPKSRLPLRKGDLSFSVRHVVMAGIDRSASVAYRVKPRSLPGDDEKYRSEKPGSDRASSRVLATWGHLSHPGWIAPDDGEMPSMRYTPVIKELPYLLEAKAVSLAPMDPAVATTEARRHDLEGDAASFLPDPVAIMFLQRPHSAPLRTYLGQLVELGVLRDPELADDFLASYEQARFAGRSLNEKQFKVLMELFAQLLDTLQEPDPLALNRMSGDSDASSISTSRGAEAAAYDANASSQLNAPSVREYLSSRGRLTPPAFNFSKNASRPSSSLSIDVGESPVSYATPGLLPTPFFTPYPEPSSAKTTSTGSLAGSERTILTNPSKSATRRSKSARRTASAFSRRSPQPSSSHGDPSQSARGLGLGMKGTGRSEQGLLLAPEIPDGFGNRSLRRSSDVSSAGSSSISSSNGSDRKTKRRSHGSDHDADTDEQGSVRRYEIDRDAESVEQLSLKPQTDSDSDGSVVRRRTRKSEPGLLKLG